MEKEEYPWYASNIREAIDQWQSDPETGLSIEETQRRLQQFGANELEEVQKESRIQAFLRQFSDFIVLVLLIAVVISILVGEWLDALAILAIVIANAAIGFFQEYRAEKAIAALRKLAAPTAEVIRNSTPQHTASRILVPGDIILIETGNSVPADARLISSTLLKVTEASLTGESAPITKMADLVLDRDTPLAERRNMVFSGSSVNYGKGKAMVTATGMHTELGKIATLVQSVNVEPTPLQRRLSQVGKFLGTLFLGLSAMIFVLGVLRGEPALDMFLTSISLAVAAIPEGLPAVVTISLAFGVQRMVKRNVLIRRLPAVETLGSVSQICTDKTGTLTEGKMAVTRIYVHDKEFHITGLGFEPEGQILLDTRPVQVREYGSLELALRIAVLCNDAQLVKNNNWEIIGDPTEGSLLVAAAKAGLWKDKLEWQFPMIFEIPFASERKRMSTIRKDSLGQQIAFVKGAPDVVLDLSTHLQIDEHVIPLDEKNRALLIQMNGAMAADALRVLAVAYKNLTGEEELEQIEEDLTFVGLFGMIDPPRQEVKLAIEKCKDANIGVTMITGDHELTATAIARALGIMGRQDMAISGNEIDRLSDEKLESLVEKIRVYARATAEDKLRIVRAWKARGHIVAMTGDGVNDAVALKEADIGIAMGITGTDVSKEASDMVLTDDNFNSIVAAVEEGRVIYENIKKFIYYLLSCNSAEVLTMLLAFIVGLPLPLLPLQILWINLVTDGLPALALGIDPAEPGIMSRSPRNPKERVINLRTGMLLAFQGCLMAGIALTSFTMTLGRTDGDLNMARTVAFGTLSFTQLLHALNWRSMTHSLLSIGILRNWFLIAAIIISGSIQMAALYLPFLQPVFNTVPLDLNTFLSMVAFSSIPLFVMEIAKFAWRISVRMKRAGQ